MVATVSWYMHATAASIGLHPADTSPKYKIGDLSKEVANTPYIARQNIQKDI
jgi:hypothetical protein